MNIFIFSSEWDLHARAVAWSLNARNIPTKILDPSRFPTFTNFSITPKSSPDKALSFAARSGQESAFDLSNVRAVWCRRMMVTPNILDYSGVHPDDLNNVIADSTAFIKGMWYLIKETLPPDVPWINPLPHLEGAASKAMQLRIANSVGFNVPDTIMGNDPALIRDFYHRHDGKIIMKPFLQRGWEENSVTRMQSTIQIEAEHLIDDAPLQLCPAIYQTLVKKQYELRVVVLGEKIIAAKLDSQSHEHSRLDWRLDAYKQVMTITPYEFSDSDKQKIYLFMRKMGLRMGSLDFIVDETGQLIFLEVNEQGQFLFLEKQCPELRMLAEVSGFLAAEAKISISGDFPTFFDYLTSDDHAEVVAEHKNYYANEIKEVRYIL